MLIQGNIKDLIYNENEEICCPHCGNSVRWINIDMGGNHSFYHFCRVPVGKDGINYTYSGRLFDFRKIKSNGKEK